MTTPRTERPLVLLYFFRLFAVLGFVPFLINTVDILLHITAPSLSGDYNPLMRGLLGVLAAPLILAIAVLCIRRAPGNLIGWSLVSFAYGASVGLMRLDLFPLTFELMLGNAFISMFWFGYLLIPLYFPDGQLYPPRANRWGNLLVGFILFFSLLIANLCATTISWDSGSSQLSVPNPFLVFEWDYRVVTIPMILILLVGGIVMVIFRYRSSQEVERLQLRWLMLGVLLQGAFSIVTLMILPAFGRSFAWVNSLYNLTNFLTIPIAIGIAVLRYRLYDIDVIIRRTLQYTLLSAVLGLVYFGSVVLLRQVLGRFTGQSALVTALSTLLIVVLFNPLRRRLQEIIDRRFFRQKYDAALALATFSTAARSEVEQAALTEKLLMVVSQTVQPQSVSLWLRKERSRR